jgi:hypothetical protein
LRFVSIFCCLINLLYPLKWDYWAGWNSTKWLIISVWRDLWPFASNKYVGSLMKRIVMKLWSLGWLCKWILYPFTVLTFWLSVWWIEKIAFSTNRQTVRLKIAYYRLYTIYQDSIFYKWSWNAWRITNKV